MQPKTVDMSLAQIGCHISKQEPMAAHTTFRIGGAADQLVTATTCEQAAAVIRLCRATDTPLLVLGKGSNLLVSDAGIAGVVLRLVPPDSAITITADGRLTAHAGVALSKVCTAAAEAGLSGLEFAFGIPGTMGGGAYMNAGAYGGQLSDVIVSVTVLDTAGEPRELTAAELAFGYRHSVFMEQDWVIWSVTMQLTPSIPTVVRAAMDDYMARRRAKQPLEYPSAGSFFKQPSGQFAGALIEQCGLKGLTVGGAQVSEKHAGFFINRGGATCADVMALCEQVRRQVKERFDVELEREVKLVGR